MDGSTIGAWLF